MDRWYPVLVSMLGAPICIGGLAWIGFLLFCNWIISRDKGVEKPK